MEQTSNNLFPPKYFKVFILFFFRFRNDNPLLQQHLLIPYTFNKATDQLEYNKDVYSPGSQAWLNNRKYLKLIADEFQVTF
jgi:hypothetical protein